MSRERSGQCRVTVTRLVSAAGWATANPICERKLHERWAVPMGRGLWMFMVGQYEMSPSLANNPAGMESKSSVIRAGKAKANR